MIKIATVYFSGMGRTKIVAEHVATGVKNAGAESILMDALAPDYDLLNACDAIIFGCPTYMGSVPAAFKKFMDDSSPVWSERKWKDKIAAGFSDSAALSGDKLITLQQLSIFAFQHGMIWVGLELMAGVSSSKSDPNNMNRIGSWIGLMTQSNTDESSPPEGDRKTAIHFGERVAEITKRFVK